MAELTPQDIVLKDKIAARIESLRLKTGLTQTEFANLNFIDRQAISRWESKKNLRGVTIYTINKFCLMVGITLKEFFDSEEFK